MSQLLELCKQGVAEVGQGFAHPGSDWAPVMFYLSDRGRAHVIMLDFTNKDYCAGIMQDRIWTGHATEAVFVSSAWTVNRDREVNVDNVVPSEESDRQECLVLTYVGQDETFAEIAHIHRSPDAPPTLGEWERVAEGLDVQGRFVDAIRAGFR